MKLNTIATWLEAQQVKIYFISIALAVVAALLFPAAVTLESGINPALAFMLFVTFMQLPLADIGRSFRQGRFLLALLITNFIALPLIIAVLIQFSVNDPMIRLGILLVLLTPCVDYVVTFSHLGRADSRLLLAATPLLLITQMLLLPIYLRVFLGADMTALVHITPFIHAFVWLIAVPFAFAALVQLWARHSRTGARFATVLGLCPVPATAVVLFIVIVSVVAQLGLALDTALRVAPVYIGFAIIAPLTGWVIARFCALDVPVSLAVAFSAGTRNSLVILPLALAIPGAMPALPVVIVTQTLTELISELAYIRLLPLLGRKK